LEISAWKRPSYGVDGRRFPNQKLQQTHAFSRVEQFNPQDYSENSDADDPFTHAARQILPRSRQQGDSIGKSLSASIKQPVGTPPGPRNVDLIVFKTRRVSEGWNCRRYSQ